MDLSEKRRVGRLSRWWGREKGSRERKLHLWTWKNRTVAYQGTRELVFLINSLIIQIGRLHCEDFWTCLCGPWITCARPPTIFHARLSLLFCEPLFSIPNNPIVPLLLSGLFKFPYKGNVPWCLSFCAWLILLNGMPSHSMHVITKDRSYLFKRQNSALSYLHTSYWKFILLLIDILVAIVSLLFWIILETQNFSYLWPTNFNSFEYITRSWIARSYRNSIFLKKVCIIFQNA